MHEHRESRTSRRDGDLDSSAPVFVELDTTEEGSNDRAARLRTALADRIRGVLES